MEARVKADCRLNTVTAFGGREYGKRDWRPVPDGEREAAEAHPYLDVRQVKSAVVESVVSPLSVEPDAVATEQAREPEAASAPPKRATRKRKGQAL